MKNATGDQVTTSGEPIMAYQPHPDFTEPDIGATVWRYMDFTKFVSILDSGCLYFARADKLGDPFEGSMPLASVIERANAVSLAARGSAEVARIISQHSEEFTRNFRKYVAVNCWHINNHESAAMWKLYLLAVEGIAIQTTYERLRNSIADEETVYFGRVEYINYNTGAIPRGNSFFPLLHKRKIFEHEKEVRAIISKPPIRDYKWDDKFVTIEHGCQIKVDVTTLIERIYVAPTSQAWLGDLVKSVVRKYGFDFPVVPSNLADSPLF